MAMQEIPTPSANRTRSEIAPTIHLPKLIIRRLETDQSVETVDATVRLIDAFTHNTVTFPNMRSRQPWQPKQLILMLAVDNLGGYFLRNAVRLRCNPLIDILLKFEADPWRNAGMTIQAAIGKSFLYSEP